MNPLLWQKIRQLKEVDSILAAMPVAPEHVEKPLNHTGGKVEALAKPRAKFVGLKRMSGHGA